MYWKPLIFPPLNIFYHWFEHLHSCESCGCHCVVMSVFIIGTFPIWQMVPWYFLPYRLVQRMANLCPHHCLPYAPSGLRSGQTPFCSNRCTLLAKAWPIWGYVSTTYISANHIHRPPECCPGNALCPIDWQRTSWDRLLLALSGIVRFGSAQTLQMSEHGFGRFTEARGISGSHHSFVIEIKWETGRGST